MTQKTVNAVNALKAVLGNMPFTADMVKGVSMATLRKNNLISNAFLIVDTKTVITAKAYNDIMNSATLSNTPIDYVKNSNDTYTQITYKYVYKFI